MSSVFIYTLASLISVKVRTDVFLCRSSLNLRRARLLVETLGAVRVG
jgi:hypothetical protein